MTWHRVGSLCETLTDWFGFLILSNYPASDPFTQCWKLFLHWSSVESAGGYEEAFGMGGGGVRSSIFAGWHLLKPACHSTQIVVGVLSLHGHDCSRKCSWALQKDNLDQKMWCKDLDRAKKKKIYMANCIFHSKYQD